MDQQPIVSHEEWLAARKALLMKEKELTRLRDELGEAVRALPWEAVEKDYIFKAPEGSVSLADLFGGKRQLIVQHFMFDPQWDQGCKSCSLMADHFDPIIAHLAARDVAMVAVSRAPLAKLEAFRVRMGWRFTWVSSHDNDFNWDYRVSFTPDQVESGEIDYNYRRDARFAMTELPGVSVFYQGESGQLFHSYSSFARGLETFLGVYRLLDIVPKGRDEGELPYGMDWVRLHDSYGADPAG